VRRASAFGPLVLRIARPQAMRMEPRASSAASLDTAREPRVEGGDSGLEERRSRSLAAVTRLSSRQRQAVMLRHFDGLAVKQIAEATGQPVGTVTKQFSRAYRRLGAWMSGS